MLLDYLLFFFRSIIRVFDYLKTSRWERTTASITDKTVLDPFWGCASVELRYRYDSSLGPAEGLDRIPFQGRSFAAYYADSFTHNMPRTIRVNPENPKETRFFERDQKALAEYGVVAGSDRKTRWLGGRISWVSIIGIPVLILWFFACDSGQGHWDCFPCQVAQLLSPNGCSQHNHPIPQKPN